MRIYEQWKWLPYLGVGAVDGLRLVLGLCEELGGILSLKYRWVHGVGDNCRLDDGADDGFILSLGGVDGIGLDRSLGHKVSLENSVVDGGDLCFGDEGGFNYCSNDGAIFSNVLCVGDCDVVVDSGGDVWGDSLGHSH